MSALEKKNPGWQTGANSCLRDRKGTESKADILLARLDGVKRTGPDRWIARCPAHNDKRPSLSIRETEDGRILMRCFAECQTRDVLAAVGLDFDVLFPDRGVGHGRPIRRAFSALDAMRCLGLEATLVLLAAKDVSEGKSLTDGDLERLATAVGRINAALEVVS